MLIFAEKTSKMGKNEYPKLLAIGWDRVMKSTQEDEEKGTLIYLLEDEEMFYGYAQNPRYIMRVKPGHTDTIALRWCKGLILPKGDEDIDKLYREAMEIINNDERLSEIRDDQKKCDKSSSLNIKAQVQRTLADPVLSKKFL
jgi:hypothetical protein